MKKASIIFLLLVLIVITFSFTFLRLGASGPENNFFNRNLRAKFATNELMRIILALHFDGDAKTDYLGNKYSKILIEVDQMQGLSLSSEILDDLRSKIELNTGKKVSYLISDREIPFAEKTNREEIDTIAKKYRNFQNQGDTVGIYLLLLNQEAGETEEVGSTYEEYGIILFSSLLKEFSVSGPKAFQNYTESTALHEFGHQLGLPHNNFSDCLMQAYVDQPRNGYVNPDSVITDFCNYEKDLIKRALN